MYKDTQENIGVFLNAWELKDIRYYLYNIINKDDIYTSDYINFAKCLFKKIDRAIEKLDSSNIECIIYNSEDEKNLYVGTGRAYWARDINSIACGLKENKKKK